MAKHKIRKCDVKGCNYRARLYIAFSSLSIEGLASISYARHVCLSHMQDTALEFSQKIQQFNDNARMADFTSI